MPQLLRKPAIQGVLCLVSGACIPVAFAPYDLYLLAPLALTVLFTVWFKCSPFAAFIYGYVFGLGMFGVGVSWLHISINVFGGMHLIGAYLLTALLVTFLALYPALVGYLSKRFFSPANSIMVILIFPALWVLAEWCRSWIFTGFPWLNLGYSQIDTALSSVAPLVGIYGVSWLLALNAGLLTYIVYSPFRNKVISGIMLLLIWSGAYLLSGHSWTEVQRKDFSAALIQGAVPQEVKWLPEYRQPSLALYRRLSEPHWGKDLIIWPETAIPAYYHQMQDFINSLREQTIANNTHMLIGLPVKNLETDDYYNSVVLFNDATSFYHKRHLVPFGEYLPLDFLFGSVIRALNIPMSSFSPGDQETALLSDSNLNIGMSICYEDVFGEEVISALPEAEILVNVSNDAWFGDSAAPHQHLQMARMRALETGRYLLRATNTGISAIIDEKGKIVSRSPQFEAVALSGEVSLFKGTTPFANFGNLPIIIFCFLILFAVKLRKFNHQPAASD